MSQKLITPELVERINRLRAQGWTYDAIGAELRLSASTVAVYDRDTTYETCSGYGAIFDSPSEWRQYLSPETRTRLLAALQRRPR